MNRSYAPEKLPVVRRPHEWSGGQSIVEFAVAVGVLSLILVVAADFARVFYFSIAVNNAARAGAQYGSQTVITAANSSGMTTAATTDGSNIPGLSATASQCTCEPQASPPPIEPCTSISSTYCAANSTATFVTVNTSAPFTTIVHYPGLPNSFTLKGKAVMQVEQ